MKKVISLLSILALLLSLSACKYEEPTIPETSGQSSEVVWLAPDSTEVLEHKANLRQIFGETWHNDVYDKNAIKIPEVEAEETMEGELWFPPINDTAPLEEIAPTISYELMLKGYNISPYYPDNPEDYTAQALNENAFPIAFFRKVNDLVYYTVCKVEGGGYMYYFFMAKSNVTYEQAAKADGRELTYRSDGSVEPDTSTEHLYRADLADLTGVDITKEAIWRASLYTEQPLGTCQEFMSKVDALFGKFSDGEQKSWQERQLSRISEIDSAGRAAADAVEAVVDNAAQTEYIAEKYYALYTMTLNRTAIITTKHLCEDGLVILSYNVLPALDEQILHSMPDEPTRYTTFSYSGLRGGGNIFSLALTELPTEQNSVMISVLPQDLME